MLSKLRNRRRTIALAVGAAAATALLPGLAAAHAGECEGSVGPVVAYVTTQVDGAVAGPNDQWGWAHPDGFDSTPGQAMQYFCFGKQP